MNCIDGTLAHHWILASFGLVIPARCSRCGQTRVYSGDLDEQIEMKRRKMQPRKTEKPRETTHVF